MTKADLVAEAAIEGIKKAIKKEGVFRYPSFGTFKLKHRKARIGINPRTKQKIKVKASKSVGFKPAAEFKSKL
jgi:DNA-binding protein HU-beta